MCIWVRSSYVTLKVSSLHGGWSISLSLHLSVLYALLSLNLSICLSLLICFSFFLQSLSLFLSLYPCLSLYIVTACDCLWILFLWFCPRALYLDCNAVSSSCSPSACQVKHPIHNGELSFRVYGAESHADRLHCNFVGFIIQWYEWVSILTTR